MDWEHITNYKPHDNMRIPRLITSKYITVQKKRKRGPRDSQVLSSSQLCSCLHAGNPSPLCRMILDRLGSTQMGDLVTQTVTENMEINDNDVNELSEEEKMEKGEVKAKEEENDTKMREEEIVINMEVDIEEKKEDENESEEESLTDTKDVQKRLVRNIQYPYLWPTRSELNPSRDRAKVVQGRRKKKNPPPSQPLITRYFQVRLKPRF